MGKEKGARLRSWLHSIAIVTVDDLEDQIWARFHMKHRKQDCALWIISYLFWNLWSKIPYIFWNLGSRVFCSVRLPAPLEDLRNFHIFLWGKHVSLQLLDMGQRRIEKDRGGQSRTEKDREGQRNEEVLNTR